MNTESARRLRAARESGQPRFIRTPTRVAHSGLVIPPIRAETDRRCWRLEDDWSYSTGEWRLTIPRGWRTDLASVPPPLNRYFNAFQCGVTGPLLHDYLYEHGGAPPEGTCEPPRRFSRREADALLRELMQAEQVSAWRRYAAWVVARALGWTHWERPRRHADACA